VKRALPFKKRVSDRASCLASLDLSSKYLDMANEIMQFKSECRLFPAITNSNTISSKALQAYDKTSINKKVKDPHVGPSHIVEGRRQIPQMAYKAQRQRLDQHRPRFGIR
jgi:hypothetical protein